MFVAASTFQRQSEPDGGGGVDPVDDVLDLVLFGDHPAFTVAAVIAIEAGGDQLAERWVGQEVSGELFDGEAVEWHVAVDCSEDPVSPSPHRAGSVVLVSAGVGVTCGIEPVDGEMFAGTWGGEQPVDFSFVGSRPRV